VAECQHFEATGGAAGGELPAGMTGLYESAGPTGGVQGASFADLVLKPKKAAGQSKAGAAGAKRGGGGGGGGGVPRRVRMARFLGLLPPAGSDGLLKPLPLLPCA